MTKSALETHQLLLEKLAVALKPKGFRKNGQGLWIRRSEPDRFAGFLMRPITRYGERVEFCIITMGGWADLHSIHWPTSRKQQSFRVGADFAQFEHDMLVPAGNGYLARLWTIWPSTSVDTIFENAMERIFSETLPAMEVMFDREQLITVLGRVVEGDEMQIRTRNYLVRHELREGLERLR